MGDTGFVHNKNYCKVVVLKVSINVCSKCADAKFHITFVVMLETSISQPSITSLLNCFPGIIYSGGATYLASETYTTKVMWKFASAHFEHTLIETFNTTTLQ